VSILKGTSALRGASHRGGQAVERLLVVEQRSAAGSNGNGHAAPYILDRHGRRGEGHDDGRRTEQVLAGLTRDDRVATLTARTEEDRLQAMLAAVHEPEYLRQLRDVDWEEPRIVPELAPPGLPADSPLWGGIVEIAFEGARAAIAAADLVAAGARFAYALSRPPGHHAGPAWLGGYCYLNTAAIVAYTLCDGGMGPVAIIDVDYHFPTGTAAIVASLKEVSLGSLHASTLDEVPWRSIEAREHERFVEFASPPPMESYLPALAATIDELAARSSALVLSLGYDTVAGDPHGSWELPPQTFEQIGWLLATTGLPVCVVQEGGNSLAALAECSQAFALGILDGCEAMS